MEFPVTLPLFGLALHPHPVFETLAYLVGFGVYRLARGRRGDFLSTPDRWTMIVAVVLGAVVGSKLLHHLANPSQWSEIAANPILLLGGKTIVGGLLGGWIAVEGTKRLMGVTRRTGDLYAIPLCLGMAIGRVGCFLTGLDDHTYGVATDLALGVDFGDGVPRHPTQLYELGFLLLLALLLLTPDANRREGTRFRVFLGGYLAFRLVVDGLKPYDEVTAGLQGIQLACLAGLVALIVGARRPDPKLA